MPISNSRLGSESGPQILLNATSPQDLDLLLFTRIQIIRIHGKPLNFKSKQKPKDQKAFLSFYNRIKTILRIEM